jgi:integrase
LQRGGDSQSSSGRRAGNRDSLSADQVASVLDGLRDHWLHPIASLALATGMRRGELLALQWSDIDLDGANLQVERSIEETRSGLRVKPPKTKRGRRNIDLPAEAVAVLRVHRKKQIELRLAFRAGWAADTGIQRGRGRPDVAR